MSELRYDAARRRAVTESLQRVDTLSAQVADGKATNEDVTAAQAQLIEDSGFNFGLLMPTYFPKYPLDEPLSFVDRPFMFAMTGIAPDSVITLKAGRQVGKCTTGDTEVRTNKGPVTMQSLFDQGVAI